VSILSSAYQLAFEISPIVLVGGIIPGGMLPIVSITQAVDFTAGLLSGSVDIDLDDFFAHFQPMPGATIADWQYGQYPFANQAVAANAAIAQPQTISLLMKCPAKGPGGYALALATMMALKTALALHVSSGGTFVVVTPRVFQPNCVLDRITDVSDQSSKQPQNAWQWDFHAPLLTLNQAQSLESNLMSQITNGTQINGQPAWSGTGATVGAPNSLVAPSLIPAASGLPAASASPFSVQSNGLPVGAPT
jgi:hypothetical protein